MAQSAREWWRPAFEVTVDAYYRGDLAAGREACEQLLSLDVLPERTELRVRQNLVYYTPTLDELIPGTTTIPIVFPVAPDWTRFNPSIAADPNARGFAMTVRTGNFTLSRPHTYTVQTGGEAIRTTNYLLELSEDLDIRSAEPIDDAAFRPEPPLFPVAGYEDCRLFWYRDSWWASATVRDRNERGKSRMALLRFEGARVVAEHLLGPQTEWHEKNWMPVVTADEELRFIYSCYPTVVLRYDDAIGSPAPELVQPAPRIAREFSGGTQLIPFEEGWLGLIHESVELDDESRGYTHRWVWFDAEWRLSSLSPPFVFQKLGVEFAAGLARRGDELIISYGRWDRDAFLAVVPIAAVRSLFAPPLNPVEIEQQLRWPSRVEAPRVAASGPTVVATTLSGNSREVIADALRSVVDWVDWVLLVDTGITDDTLEIARTIASEKLVVREFPWRDDFAAARNFALEAAAELGADWAMTLDTDERIELAGADIPAVLAATRDDTLQVMKKSGNYGKERFFRLPVRGHWIGPTHEAFIRESGDSSVIAGVVFSELSKSDDEYRRKVERDIAILTRHATEHPDDPRWSYYLGDSLAGLGRYEEAIEAFRACTNLDGWDEEAAWAMYRVGQCLLNLGRPGEAVGAYAEGMAKHAGLAELPWMAAFASWEAGRPAQAVYWARLAIATGHFAGVGAKVPRIGFRHPPGLWEGPYDVLRFALRQLGDEAGADEAERLYHEARAAREGSGSQVNEDA